MNDWIWYDIIKSDNINLKEFSLLFLEIAKCVALFDSFLWLFMVWTLLSPIKIRPVPF